MTNTEAKVNLATLALHNLPRSIRQSLLSNKSLTNQLGISTTTHISLSEKGPSFQRADLFDRVREALKQSSLPQAIIDDKGGAWSIKIEVGIEAHRTLLQSDKLSIELDNFWAFSESRDDRLKYFDVARSSNYLSPKFVDQWRQLLSERSITDDEYDDLAEEIAIAPSNVAVIAANTFELKGDLRFLVPSKRRYYTRLVGEPSTAANFSQYASSEILWHTQRLSEWNAFEGTKLALLLSAHASISPHIDIWSMDKATQCKLYSWLTISADFLSKLGAIEMALANINEAPYLEEHVGNLIEQILSDDATSECGRFSILSQLYIIVYCELASNANLKDTPPFWRRLAALAHASLLERAAISKCPGSTSFLDRHRNKSTYIFRLQNLIDLRSEPRWLPDFAHPTQIKSNFLIRIHSALENARNKIVSSSLQAYLPQEGPGHSTYVHFPNSFLPGPMEGGEKPETRIPDGILSAINETLSSGPLTISSFAATINSFMIFDVNPNIAALTAEAIKRVQYKIELSDDAHFSSLLNGLASAAAIARSTALAKTVNILCRAYRNRLATKIPATEELNIALIAAASNETRNDWASFLGNWLTELAYETNEADEQENLLVAIRQLFLLEPSLVFAGTKAEAALSSVVKKGWLERVFV